tara:strand:- start:2190 stop:2381 length:192 start_codon:yes stop_codon:yes gene_type:complete
LLYKNVKIGFSPWMVFMFTRRKFLTSFCMISLAVFSASTPKLTLAVPSARSDRSGWLLKEGDI